ncbi:hypothetical protein AB024_22665 [Salmonella enterica]|nr:hypothetical protein [Salmonella enterica]EAX1483789.1 hypothetical protein [Salmonella enterica]EBJ3958674.1 hypothetical protein [Salmonella enterica]
MTTITKERIELFVKSPLENGLTRGEQMELARSVLASLDAEPAGYHVIRECGKVGCSVATLEEAEKTRDFWNKKWTIRPYFYTAPPAPVVPLSITLPDTSSKAFWSGTGKKEVFHPETYKRWVNEAIERFCMIAGIAVEVKS